LTATRQTGLTRAISLPLARAFLFENGFSPLALDGWFTPRLGAIRQNGINSTVQRSHSAALKFTIRATTREAVRLIRVHHGNSGSTAAISTKNLYAAFTPSLIGLPEHSHVSSSGQPSS
jgi:hypothetical protein